jgi:hypothetical protein
VEKSYHFNVTLVANVPDDDDWDESDLITEVESNLEDIAFNEGEVELVSLSASLAQ